MADGTGGNVTIVDLLNIRDEFASILEQKVIATNVEATLIVHRGLYIRDPEDPDSKLDKIKRDIGNVTKQTQVSFEFGIRNNQELKDKYNIDLDQIKQLPFQVQVIYTSIDGTKALRVLTKLQETTEQRAIAEVNAYRDIIADNHIRCTAAEMMLSYDDGDDDEDIHAEGARMRSKWSSPVMQKQRRVFMDNLNARKHAARSNEDDFNEKRWKKASEQLNSHVVSSKSRKKAAPLNPVSSTAGHPSLFGRISRMFTGAPTEASADSTADAHSSKPSRSKRSYGFATTKLSHFSDKNSEDLYKFKNLSSNYLRLSTSEKEEDKPSAESATSSLRIDKKDDDNDNDAGDDGDKNESGSA